MPLPTASPFADAERWFAHPLIRLDVHVTCCSYCSWRFEGDSVSMWRDHMAVAHPSEAEFMERAVDAIRGHGTYDTDWEAACYRIAGLIERATSEVASRSGEQPPPTRPRESGTGGGTIEGGG